MKTRVLRVNGDFVESVHTGVTTQVGRVSQTTLDAPDWAQKQDGVYLALLKPLPSASAGMGKAVQGSDAVFVERAYVGFVLESGNIAATRLLNVLGELDVVSGQEGFAVGNILQVWWVRAKGKDATHVGVLRKIWVGVVDGRNGDEDTPEEEGRYEDWLHYDVAFYAYRPEKNVSAIPEFHFTIPYGERLVRHSVCPQGGISSGVIHTLLTDRGKVWQIKYNDGVGEIYRTVGLEPKLAMLPPVVGVKQMEGHPYDWNE